MPTNVVFIMTDNQGAWTLGCYGNEDIRTPNIDRMAEDGIRFSNAYCVNSVCSPSRATFLTGLIPSQHGVHCWLGTEKPDAQIGPDAYCTIQEFANLPRMLSDAEYTCGLSGKWHLGDSIRPQEGFSYWFTKPKGHTDTFYNAEAIWEGKIYKEPRYYTDVITEHALDFLEQNHEDPFFLYVPYNGPYGLGAHMTSEHKNRHTAYYADKELPSFPREPIHSWLRGNRQIVNNPVSIKGYAAAVSGVDDGVGAILEALSNYGLDDDTLVIFTADQGLCGGHHGMRGMGDHSRPMHTFEETIHIPLIFRHNGQIPAGTLFEHRTCNYDFFPSVLDYLGMSDRLPEAPELPGKSYFQAMLGKDIGWDDVFFHEFENARMVRSGKWKYTWRHPQGPDELYDMQNDPGECSNLAGNMEYASIIEKLRAQINEFFSRYADPKYDLWRDGLSKAGRMI